MSQDNRTQEPNDGLEVSYRIPVERFAYEDELKKRNAKLEKRNRTLLGMLGGAALFSLLLGWGVGSFRPIPFFNNIRHGVTYVTQSSSDNKISNVFEIMRRYWYFARNIENIETRLTDQALTGMTTNEEDPHTSYMSAEEIQSFTQNINRNFVGIGVQFTSLEDGLHLVTRVFRDSPAEKAGVQAGDIIHSINGVIADNKTVDEIKELVQGEEGTDVTIVFLREGKYVTLDITRGNIGHTVDGTQEENNIGIINIEQFGETTKTEVQSYLEEFQEAGITKLVIDLRDDGGGYLEALQGVVSLFLPANKTFIQREYADGTEQSNKTEGGEIGHFSPIVLLVNENTASAAEAFTLGMRENRDDVIVVGTTTYGKGSVQVTQYFDDGSAIKYTDSIWKSPKGNWINETGITPDEIVELHPVLNSAYPSPEEEGTVKPDMVSEYVKEIQLCLDFLGYPVKRTDGYYDEATAEQIVKFEKDYELKETTEIDTELYSAFISAVIHEWTVNPGADTQLQKAFELLNQNPGEAPAAAVMPEDAVPAAPCERETVMAEMTGNAWYKGERYGTI